MRAQAVYASNSAAHVSINRKPGNDPQLLPQRPHVVLAFIEPAEYRNVEILGILRANLRATGNVTIRAGGSLEEEMHGEHLSVEDGGGLG